MYSILKGKNSVNYFAFKCILIWTIQEKCQQYGRFIDQGFICTAFQRGEKYCYIFNSVNHFAFFAQKYLNLGKSGTNKNQVLLFPLWHNKYLYIQIEINMTLAIF